MLVFDQLKKNDPQLRLLALAVLCGLGVLLAGLWWVQVVSARQYQSSLETQSYRTVRIPAVRGKILDRNGIPLAENRPTYNISLYLEELRKPFDSAYFMAATNARADLKRKAEARAAELGRSLNKHERKEFALSGADRAQLRQKARSFVASNVVAQVSAKMGMPIPFNPESFERHYDTRLALPFPILSNLDPTNIARFQEQSSDLPGVDVEILSTRLYPFGTTAAHVLGYLIRDDRSEDGEESFFSYRLPDFRGLIGVEAGYDRTLRGVAGEKSVLVNNVGYRQTEKVWFPAEPGTNVVLTIDTRLQQAAERALQSAQGPSTKGAVVVMDVRTGDILAMVSAPTFNPNSFVPSITSAEYRKITEMQAEKNRATHENYMPGSIFKTVVALAALDAGWNPNEIIHSDPNPAQPNRGHIKVGNHTFKDTAEPGDYNFKRALKLSSNTYFITCGLRVGAERIVRMGHRLHFGERAGLPTRQEVSGSFPEIKRVTGPGWRDGNTANLSIGQDPVWVTPLQIAVLTSAIANGGKVLWPRLIDRVVSPDPLLGGTIEVFPSGKVRDELGVSSRSMKVLHDAMLADTEDADGTGRKAVVPGLRICAKTGTAQVQDEHNVKTGLTTWFASFAPYENPKYAVVVMVENGVSGGATCAPVAGQIYSAILEMEQGGPAKGGPVARNR
jgi:penicillin-binding protein 2